MKQVEHDQIIVSQHNLGDFKNLYEQHYFDVFNQVEKRINDEVISADITQQVFLETIKSVKKYSYKQYSLSTHLYRTVIDKCAKFFRSGRNKRHIVINEQMSTNLLSEIGLMHCHEGKTKKLVNALELLTIQEIELLELRFVECKIFQEQGYIMNMSENKAKLRTYSLLNKIKHLMKSDSAAFKKVKKVEILDIKDPTPKEKIKSYMSFDLLWEEFKSSRVNAFQILRKAVSYIEGNVLKRAFVSFGLIIFFGVFTNYYLDEKLKKTETDVEPEILIQELNIDRVNQMDIAYSTNMACLNV